MCSSDAGLSGSAAAFPGGSAIRRRAVAVGGAVRSAIGINRSSFGLLFGCHGRGVGDAQFLAEFLFLASTKSSTSLRVLNQYSCLPR